MRRCRIKIRTSAHFGVESLALLANRVSIFVRRSRNRVALTSAPGLDKDSERIYFSRRILRYMTTIRVKENEPFDVALRRFKRTIEKLGLLTELRAREFYEKPTVERKRKKAAAVKRHYKRVRSMQLPKKLY